jgi:hypothetical protein
MTVKSKRIIVPKLYLEGLVLALLLFGLSLLVVHLHPSPSSNTNRAGLESGTSLEGLLTDTTTAEAQESWLVHDQPLLENVTGTSTIVEADRTIAMFETHDGAIWRRESENGVDFSDPVRTGIEEDASVVYDQRQVIGRPGVLQLSSNEYLLVYEQSVRQRPEVPQIDQPRQLYAARSSDGRTFAPIGQILDSARHDAGYASDPELLLLPDRSIRLFYTSEGDRIASLRSEDKGKTWVSEGERLTRISGDADVLYLGDYYAMYYTYPGEAISEQGGLEVNLRIRKAYAVDGLTFVKTSKTLIADPNFQDTVDPDVVIQPDGTVRMYFGHLRPGTTPANPAYDLYMATATVE